MHFSKKIIFCSLFSVVSVAKATVYHHPFYLGVLGGYASTTWSGLVPKDDNQSSALNMSTPVKVKEGGPFVGAVAGLEIAPTFAIELNYYKLHEATIAFDPLSIFSFNNEGSTQLVTNTEVVSVMGKLMVSFPDPHFRLLSGAGIADVHRQDLLIDNWRLAPTFSVGLNTIFRDRLMGEIVGNYTAGYGESQLSPAEAYYPFLYSVSLRLLYCFG